MKKYSIPILLFIMFIPFMVNAETCDTSSITIDSINVDNISGNAEELSSATISGKKINLDLKLYDPGDSIEYTLSVKNTSSEDFYFDEESLKLNTDYIEYEFSYDDNSNIVKARESKTIKLKVEYKNKVPTSQLVNDTFNDTNTLTLNLSNKKIINVPDTIKNPETGDIIIRYILVLIICIGICLILLKKKKSIKLMILILGAAIIIPMSVYALCKCDIEVETKIQIDGKEAYFLTGSEVNIKMKRLAEDDTSSNGEKTLDSNIIAIKYSETEPNDTNKEDKNIVSLSDSPYPIYMWYDNGTIYWWSEDKSPNLNEDSSNMFRSMHNLSNIDGLANIDTSNCKSLYATFVDDLSITNVNALSRWNTSNVESMRATFSTNKDTFEAGNIPNLVDISGLADWDTSSVTTLRTMFQNAINLQSLEPLAKWDTSRVVEMNLMFAHTLNLENLHGLEHWDTSNVVNMQSMFIINSSAYDAGVRNKLKDISAIGNWNVSKVTNFKAMFQFSELIESANALNDWNIDSTASFQHMFYKTPVHPEFTKVQGTWDSNGTFIPS